VPRPQLYYCHSLCSPHHQYHFQDASEIRCYMDHSGRNWLGSSAALDQDATVVAKSQDKTCRIRMTQENMIKSNIKRARK
jgi:hypothetical protein